MCSSVIFGKIRIAPDRLYISNTSSHEDAIGDLEFTEYLSRSTKCGKSLVNKLLRIPLMICGSVAGQ